MNESYITCILAAGGTPVLIPYMDHPRLSLILKLIDGLLVPGGIDIDAQLFNEELHPKSGIIDPWWDKLDVYMIGGAIERKLPILAICRGCQILNVTCGGSVIQDIPSSVSQPLKHHQQAPKWYATHNVTITKGSRLASIFERDVIKVNSFHHQAVGRLAPSFNQTAIASDGIIEAIESNELPFVIGVQWHPELMTVHYPVFQQLFNQFVAIAIELKSQR